MPRNADRRTRHLSSAGPWSCLRCRCPLSDSKSGLRIPDLGATKPAVAPRCPPRRPSSGSHGRSGERVRSPVVPGQSTIYAELQHWQLDVAEARNLAPHRAAQLRSANGLPLSPGKTKRIENTPPSFSADSLMGSCSDLRTAQAVGGGCYSSHPETALRNRRPDATREAERRSRWIPMTFPRIPRRSYPSRHLVTVLAGIFRHPATPGRYPGRCRSSNT